MGIRYYAYAFDGELTERALADPRSIISSDPLADAWGFEPGARIAAPSFVQAVPVRDMLYLDKAWSNLQSITAPEPGAGSARAAYRMFEGRVQQRDCGWDAWVRALAPAEAADIAGDLGTLTDEDARTLLLERGRFYRDPEDEVAYAMHYLHQARDFMDQLTATGRGMVYMIG